MKTNSFTNKIIFVLLMLTVNFSFIVKAQPPCPTYTGTFTVTSGTVLIWNVSQSITTDVIIQSHATLVISSCAIYFPISTSITVQSGGTLIIDNGTLTTPCTKLWRGIIVENGGTINTMNYSEIENAVYGVELQDGSAFDIRNTTFDLDYIGIFVAPSATPVTFAYAFMDGNVFDCTGPLLQSPLLPFISLTNTLAGIFVNNVNMPIDGNSGLNTFQNLNNGIVAQQSFTKIRNCVFYHIKQSTYGALYDGCGIFASGGNATSYLDEVGLGNFSGSGVFTFIDCYTGIFTDGISANVEDNDMDQMDYGTRCWKSNNCSVNMSGQYINCYKIGMDFKYNDQATAIVVSSNIIDLDISPSFASGGIGISVEDFALSTNPNNYYFFMDNVNSDNGYIGFYANNANYITARWCVVRFNRDLGYQNYSINNGHDNYFKCCDAYKNNGFLAPGEAEFAFNSTLSPQIVCCTTYVGNTGFRFDGYCGTGIFRTNRMVNNDYTGLHLGSTAIIGPQIGQSNIWIGSFPLSGYGAIADPNSSLLSPFATVTGLMPTFSPPGWFTYSPLLQIPCNAPGGECPQLIPLTDGISDADSILANGGTLGITEFSAEIDKTGIKYLYEKLDHNNSLVYFDQALWDFFNLYTNNSVGDLQIIKNEGANLKNINPGDQVIIQDNLNKIKYYLNEFHSNYKLLADSNSSQITRELTERRDSIIRDSSDYLITQNQLLLQGIDVNYQNNINSILSHNSTVFSTDIIDQNEKIVNDIYYSTVEKNILNFSVDQESQLYSIANQCPLAGGSSVFKARGLLSIAYDNIIYDDVSLCSANGISISRMNGHIFLEDVCKIQISPNPVHDIIQFDVNGRCNNNYEIYIYSVLGELVKSGNITPKLNIMTIPISGISPGIYICKILLNNIPIKSEKIVITK